MEWYDIKTKFKKIIRSISYSFLFQELICYIALSYIYLVYLTSEKQFINLEKIIHNKKNKPIIAVFWHNRLMMIPFLANKAKKIAKNNGDKVNFMTLSSKHGDGRFVGKITKKFSFTTIEGSTRNNRKLSRGIDFTATKQIISGLKNGDILGITPDGPRGPAKQINGDIINISYLSKADIIAVSYSASNQINLNSWDKFTIPLPFSKLVFFCDDVKFSFDKKLNSTMEASAKLEIANRMNITEDTSLAISQEKSR